MDLSDNLTNSFAFAKKLFSDFGRLVILIVLDLIPIVNLIVTGYASRVLKELTRLRNWRTTATCLSTV